MFKKVKFMSSNPSENIDNPGEADDLHDKKEPLIEQKSPVIKGKNGKTKPAKSVIINPSTASLDLEDPKAKSQELPVGVMVRKESTA